MIEFVLSIASAVLANVITELVTGRRKAARMEEMKQEVASQIEQHSQLQNENQTQTLQLVLEEMIKLIERDSALKLAKDQIELKKSLELPFISPKRNVNEEVKLQLEHLSTIVVARRRELGLPLQSEELGPVNGNVRENDPHSSSVEWKQVQTEQPEQTDSPVEKNNQGLSTVWKQVRKEEEDKALPREILEMQEKIRQWRAGEDN